MTLAVPLYPYTPRCHEWSVTRFLHNSQTNKGDKVEYIGLDPNKCGLRFTFDPKTGQGGVKAECYHITFTPKHAVDKVFKFTRLHAQVLDDSGGFKDYFTRDMDYRRVDSISSVPAQIIEDCRKDWIRVKGYG